MDQGFRTRGSSTASSCETTFYLILQKRLQAAVLKLEYTLRSNPKCSALVVGFLGELLIPGLD